YGHEGGTACGEAELPPSRAVPGCTLLHTIVERGDRPTWKEKQTGRTRAGRRARRPKHAAPSQRNPTIRKDVSGYVPHSPQRSSTRDWLQKPWHSSLPLPRTA